MILKNLEYWVLAQVGLEIILILLLVFFLMKIRSMSKIIGHSQKEENSTAGRLKLLADQLAALETKRVALEESLGFLGEKALSVNGSSPSRRGAAPGYHGSALPQSTGGSLRLQVEDLHSQGFSSAEIAHRLGLHPTEVKMALELSRLKAEQP